MLQRPAFLSGALRLVAVGLGVAAIAVVLQQGEAKRPGDAFVDAAVAEPVAVAEAAPAPRSWSLRSAGWYIQIDGADVDVPTVGEQTAAPPRASLATSISPYDHLIVHHAKAEGFDWRLIAALIFEESLFDPKSRSDKGAYGLMQVRPIAAEAVGAEHFKLPDDNVKTGVRYLRQLDEMFREAQGRDRLSLVLAAYNIGPGHLRDAQTLARRFGYDPERWEDAMDLMLPLLEQPSIYTHLPYGFAKGSDTVTHVQRIIDRYHRYQRETPGTPDTDDEADALSSSEAFPANG